MASLSFDDTGWQTVGIPHCYNEQDTYLNTSTGERCWRGEASYQENNHRRQRPRPDVLLGVPGSEHRGGGVCERYADKKQYEGGAAGSGDPCGERASLCSGHHALPALWRREPDSGKGVQCRGYVFHLARFRDQRRLRSGHGRYRLPRLPAQEEQGAHSFRFLFSYGQVGDLLRDGVGYQRQSRSTFSGERGDMRVRKRATWNCARI